jgi:hypothetical protein
MPSPLNAMRGSLLVLLAVAATLPAAAQNSGGSSASPGARQAAVEAERAVPSVAGVADLRSNLIVGVSDAMSWGDEAETLAPVNPDTDHLR